MHDKLCWFKYVPVTPNENLAVHGMTGCRQLFPCGTLDESRYFEFGKEKELHHNPCRKEGLRHCTHVVACITNTALDANLTHACYQDDFKDEAHVQSPFLCKLTKTERSIPTTVLSVGVA